MNGQCMMTLAQASSVRSPDKMTITETDVMTITIPDTAAMAVPYNLIFYLKYFTGINGYTSLTTFLYHITSLIILMMTFMSDIRTR